MPGGCGVMPKPLGKIELINNQYKLFLKGEDHIKIAKKADCSICGNNNHSRSFFYI